MKRNTTGLAIGGLSGGEDKKDFCRIIYYTVNELRRLKYMGPIYLMGVGYADDIIICCALGSDMSDCVYPTRTARIGRILVADKDIDLKNSFLNKNKKKYDLDRKLCVYTSCDCTMCVKYSLRFMLNIKGTPNFCSLMTEHNLKFMRELTNKIRINILNGTFVRFIKEYFNKKYGAK